MTGQIPFSVLDFAPVRSGETPREALQQVVDLARKAEALRFKRFWVVEHHGQPLAASAATPVIIGHIAGKTSTIRVGAGGVMLPNHSPLVIAEQFGTLASFYPGRIDLGMGRASGSTSDDGILRALRWTQDARDRFPIDLREVQSLFREPAPDQVVQAVPGAGLDVPIWLLGSSTFSAQQAGTLGLPFAFATHIGPDSLGAALNVYRSTFKPSEALKQPYIMICVAAVAAETDAGAQRLFTSFQQVFIEYLRGTRGTPLRPPTDRDAFATVEERTRIEHWSRHAIIGSPETVQRRAEALIDETAADELMVLTLIYDQDARHRSFEIVAGVRDRITA
jgi:luciferase family oxidoreductase group 1